MEIDAKKSKSLSETEAVHEEHWTSENLLSTTICSHDDCARKIKFEDLFRVIWTERTHSTNGKLVDGCHVAKEVKILFYLLLSYSLRFYPTTRRSRLENLPLSLSVHQGLTLFLSSRLSIDAFLDGIGSCLSMLFHSPPHHTRPCMTDSIQFIF